MHPLVARAPSGLVTPTLAALGAATAAGIYAFNGYDAAIFFGEDMRDARRTIAPVVLLALAAAVIMVLPAMEFPQTMALRNSRVGSYQGDDRRTGVRR